MTDLQLTSTFCIVDSFCKSFLPEWQKMLVSDGKYRRKRTDCLSISEIITILLWFNDSGLNCFKKFYNSFEMSLRLYFPTIPSYKRFVKI